MTVLGWGIDPFGTSPYGSVTISAAIRVQSAVAISTNEVRVVLTGPALHEYTTVEGDALNPNTWQVQNLDTLQFLNVMSIRPETPSIYIISTLQKFGPATTLHRVSSVTLLGENGLVVVPPHSADFSGILSEIDADVGAKLSDQRVLMQDIRNLPTSQNVAYGTGGTLRITSGGDYESVSGDELVKKLILRRLMSKPGDFFHLPNYGIGFKNKEPVNVSELVKLKAAIEQQSLLEPEVSQCQAILSIDSQGILSCTVRAKLKPSGQQIDLALTGTQFAVAL